MLNVREMDVLAILWNNDEALTATDIVGKKRGLTQSTVTAVLHKLLTGKMVEVTGTTHSGKVLSRTYRPTELSIKVIREELLTSYELVSEEISPSEMCMLIIGSMESGKKQKEEITKLKKNIRDYEVILKNK